MRFQELIERKRDGLTHSRAELQIIAEAAAKGSAKDYQLSAWLMAAFLRGLSSDETLWLTQAMAASGERLDLSSLPHPWVDKHSTGGVGDKTSIVVLPLLAACGLTVVKMSGRGLGITGGTIDKLASVPGFRTQLSVEEMLAQAKRIGLALTGQSAHLAPADGALYALRDATGTVESIPLIVSSILSKKIAGGAEVIVLDVKCGSGALMKTRRDAMRLARALLGTGEKCGLRVRAMLTDMSQPLGRSAGNLIEVQEAIRVLSNEQPGRFQTLCIALAGHALVAAGLEADGRRARGRVREVLRSGAGLQKAGEWFQAQGGTLSLRDVLALPLAKIQTAVKCRDRGWVQGLNAETVGQCVVELGGGRKSKEDSIDPLVGIETLVEVGARVLEGQPVFRIHAASVQDARMADSLLQGAIVTSPAPVRPKLPVLASL